jgi:pilus assembly protein Flp/PilA
MKQLVQKFLRDESGATMVEYAILVALIAVAVIATVVLVGEKIDEVFNKVIDEIDANAGTGGGTPTP